MELDASSAITLKTTPSQADISAQVADESILRAEVVNNHVLLYAQKLGKTTLTITARQEGYAPYETKLEIEVTGQKTPFAVEDTVLRVEAGGQAEIPFELLQGAELALEYDKSLYSVSIQENRLLVKGLAPGQGVLRIRAQHEEYAPRVRSVNVIVSKPKLSFENLPQTLSVQHGGSYMLPVKVSERPR